MARLAFIFSTIFIYVCSAQFTTQGTYTATIVEFGRTSQNTGYDEIIARTTQYEQMIGKENTNIIIFPEYGLTTPNLPENLTSISTLVPDPLDKISPCDNASNFAQHLIKLSCAAKTHKRYVVVNLIEKHESEEIYYNTNVVFDVEGIVVARYRKINLCNEPRLTRGDKISTFEALVGVKFGLMTGCDLLHSHPAQSLLQAEVTDIIFPHAWRSEAPFLHTLSVQDGFAKASGVNFLSAPYNNPRDGLGGGGFFFADANSTTVISTAISTRSVTETVATVTQRTPSAVCQNNINKDPRGIGTIPDIASFNTSFENMDLYTFQNLEITNGESKVQVCSEGSSFCCDFYVKFKEYASNTVPIYKAVAFFGQKRMGQSSDTLGIRTCALVACASDDNSSCGKRPDSSNAVFDTITVNANLPTGNVMYMPSTLSMSLKPLEKYTFCHGQEDEDKTIGYSMTANNIENVLTFGIFGREYDLDGKPEGRGTGNFVHPVVGLLVSLLTVYFFI